MAISILHIGLPLDHPAIPAAEGPKIAKRLREIEEMMRGAGYDYQVVHASPEGGLDGFRRQLRTQRCDGVLIGGGVVGDESLRHFMEQIINVTHEAAPHAKIVFFNHAESVLTSVDRWFRPRVNEA